MVQRVLIIEDDASQAEMTAALLRPRGVRVVIAGDAQSGLSLAQSLVPDLILLDIGLPDGNGFDLCQTLRSQWRTVRIPVVMLTGLGPHRSAEGYRVGANAYVTKPFSRSQLFDAIDRALAWRERLEEIGLAAELAVELQSQTELLHRVNEFLAILLVQTRLSDDEVIQLRQVFMELGQNAIEWGNRFHPEKVVWVTYRLYKDRVELTIRDQGNGFDRTNLPHAATLEDPVSHLEVRETLGIRVGGFGLLISEGIADEIRYNDRGNEVTILKRMPGAVVAELDTANT